MHKNAGRIALLALLPFVASGCLLYDLSTDFFGTLKQLFLTVGWTVLSLIWAFLTEHILPDYTDFWSLALWLATAYFLYSFPLTNQLAEGAAKILWFLCAAYGIFWVLTTIPKEMDGDALFLLVIAGIAGWALWKFVFMKILWERGLKKIYEMLMKNKHFPLLSGLLLMTGVICRVVSTPGNDYWPSQITAICGVLLFIYDQVIPRFAKWRAKKKGEKGEMTDYRSLRRRTKFFLHPSRQPLALLPPHLPDLRECPACHKMGVSESNSCCFCQWEWRDEASATESPPAQPTPAAPQQASQQAETEVEEDNPFLRKEW